MFKCGKQRILKQLNKCYTDITTFLNKKLFLFLHDFCKQKYDITCKLAKPMYCIYSHNRLDDYPGYSLKAINCTRKRTSNGTLHQFRLC